WISFIMASPTTVSLLVGAVQHQRFCATESNRAVTILYWMMVWICAGPMLMALLALVVEFCNKFPEYMARRRAKKYTLRERLKSFWLKINENKIKRVPIEPYEIFLQEVDKQTDSYYRGLTMTDIL